MKKLLVFVVMAFAILGFSGIVIAEGINDPTDHQKITGDVNWTSARGVENLRTVFSVHLDAPGKNPIRGTVTHYNPDGSMRIVEVDNVMVSGNEAWIVGEITYADGVFSGQEGMRSIHWMKDIATPGSEGDLIGAWKGNHDDKIGSWTGGGIVTSGNLMVH